MVCSDFGMEPRLLSSLKSRAQLRAEFRSLQADSGCWARRSIQKNMRTSTATRSGPITRASYWALFMAPHWAWRLVEKQKVKTSQNGQCHCQLWEVLRWGRLHFINN